MNRASLAYGMSLAPAKYRPPVHHGVAHPMAKLSDAQVHDIRHSTDSQVACARRHRVHQSRVSRIRAGKAWAGSTVDGEAGNG